MAGEFCHELCLVVSCLALGEWNEKSGMYLNIQGPFHQTLAFVAISPSATRQALAVAATAVPSGTRGTLVSVVSSAPASVPSASFATSPVPVLVAWLSPDVVLAYRSTIHEPLGSQQASATLPRVALERSNETIYSWPSLSSFIQ